MNFLQRGGVWVLSQFVLMMAVIGLAVRFHGNGSNHLVMAVSVVLFGAGAVVGLAGAVTLGANLTPFPRPLERGEFVRSGVYARIRHPLYTSVMLASFGWALFWGSWPSLAAACSMIPFFALKARREERWLRKKFPAYEDYGRQVPRFLPCFRRCRDERYH